VNDHDLEGWWPASTRTTSTRTRPIRSVVPGQRTGAAEPGRRSSARSRHPARVLRSAVDGDVPWTELEMSGTRRDGGVFDMRVVFIFGVAAGRARWARMFLEPVEQTSGDVNASVRSVTGDRPAETSGTRS